MSGSFHINQNSEGGGAKPLPASFNPEVLEDAGPT